MSPTAVGITAPVEDLCCCSWVGVTKCKLFSVANLIIDVA